MRALARASSSSPSSARRSSRDRAARASSRERARRRAAPRSRPGCRRVPVARRAGVRSRGSARRASCGAALPRRARAPGARRGSAAASAREPWYFAPFHVACVLEALLAACRARITLLRARAASSFHGVSRSKPCASATCSRKREVDVREEQRRRPTARVTASAPVADRERRVARRRAPRSGGAATPRPSHSGQAPCGELNENRRGSSGGVSAPQPGQVRLRRERALARGLRRRRDDDLAARRARAPARAPRAGARARRRRAAGGRRRPRSCGARSARARAPPRCAATAPSTRARTKPCAAQVVEERACARPCGRAPAARARSTRCAGELAPGSAARSPRASAAAPAGRTPGSARVPARAKSTRRWSTISVSVPTVERGLALTGLLVDRDRRREALDRLDVGLLHAPEELARVGRERLEEAPLALAEERVEGERGLARARDPRDRDQAVARDVDVDAARGCSGARRRIRIAAVAHAWALDRFSVALPPGGASKRGSGRAPWSTAARRPRMVARGVEDLGSRRSRRRRRRASCARARGSPRTSAGPAATMARRAASRRRRSASTTTPAGLAHEQRAGRPRRAAPRCSSQ